MAESAAPKEPVTIDELDEAINRAVLNITALTENPTWLERQSAEQLANLTVALGRMPLRGDQSKR